MPLLLVSLAVACSPRAGCARKVGVDRDGAACADLRPALIEVRDGQGALLIALRQAAGGGGEATLCDPGGRALGHMIHEENGLSLRDLAGTIGSRLQVPRIDEPQLSFDHDQRTVRLHTDGVLLRLLDERGVPLGQLEQQPGRAIAFDAAGRGLVTSERVEQQDETRMALRAPDGSTQRIILGLRSERAAAVFALPGLPLPEALLVARFLDGKPGAAER